MAAGWAKTHRLVKDHLGDEPPLNAIQIRLLAWIMNMEAYLAMRHAGLPICAVRYEDLVAHPADMVSELLAYCGIQESLRPEIEEVLARDSQAGTIYARENREQGRSLIPDYVAQIYAMVASRPLLGSPDVVLPGTLTLEP
jgi:hypothetical protein